MSGKPADAAASPQRTDRSTRYAQGPAPVPAVEGSDSSVAAAETMPPPGQSAPPRQPRSTVMGTPDVLADAARKRAESTPPPVPKRSTGRHKTAAEIGSKVPAALKGAQSQQDTVIGPPPVPDKPTVRRGSGSFSRVSEDAAPDETPIPVGKTVVPGALTTEDLATQTGKTVVPGSMSAPHVDKRPTPVVEYVPPTEPPPELAAKVVRPKTQPMGAGNVTHQVTDREDIDESKRKRSTSPTRTDAAERRNFTHFHGAAGLVDAGTESPKLRLVPGKVVPGTRYKLLRWLGEGGMGVVYEAAHVDIERRSALKILRFDLSQQPRMTQVFRDEARAASRLGSPHIVEIYDFGELPDGRLFFAMELLDGHDLVPTEEEPVIPADRLVGILRQVCKGLAAAHDAGVVHRDVKPENIIVGATDDRKDVAKIVDFGISSMLAAGQTDGGGIAGTPHYMAPEQILGDKFDSRLDVYALGCTAYELLVGVPPFDAEDVEDILQQQVSKLPDAPRTVRPDLQIPAALESVIMRCLAKSPEQRFPNMEELEAALCEAQISAGITTPWDDLPVPQLADPDRRATIVAKMPNAPHAATKRGWVWPVVAGLSTLAAAGLALFLAFRGGPTDEELSIVEKLTAEAQDAATDQIWVVPMAHKPDAPTAYMKVVELEDVEGPAEDAADDRAEELRDRFATSLVATADQLWDQGAEDAARRYYLYALTFDMDHERALERFDHSPVMLAKFRDHARTGDFDLQEQLLATAAGAQAEQDPAKREGMENAVEEVIETQPEISAAQLAQLAEAAEGTRIREKVEKRVKRGSGIEPTPVAAPPSADPFEEEAAPDEPGVEDVLIEEPEPTKPKPKFKPKPRQEQDGGELLGKAKRDPVKAAELAAQGQAALRSGQRQKATSLFNQAIAYDRRNAKALMGLSDVYFDTGSNQKAINYAEKAVAAAPKSGAYRIKLGDAYYKVLRYKDAKAQYQKAKDLGAKRAKDRLAKVNAKLGG